MFVSTKKPIFNKYILSIAHIDYKQSVGGVEKLISEQSDLFKKNNISYVVLCPMRHVPSDMYKVYVDDMYLGSFKIKVILGFMASWNNQLIACHIHHIQNWRYEDIQYMFEKVETEYLFYLHDYYYICSHYNLINSEELFCGIQLPSESKCFKCSYYQKEKKNIEKIIKLFHITARKKQTFIAPSKFVKEVWISLFPEYRDKTLVIEHLSLYGEKKVQNKDSKQIRIAYVGAQYKIKGWDVFERLMNKLKEDKRYMFYHFGMPMIKSPNIINFPITYSKDGKNAMSEAIKSNNIDYVILFPQWPETYNYTCYEAYMAGAYILTNNNSGNIQDMVNDKKCGKILKNEEELLYFFESDECLSTIIKYRESNFLVPEKCEINHDILHCINIDEKGLIKCKGRTVLIENWKGIVYDLKHFKDNNRGKCI